MQSRTDVELLNKSQVGKSRIEEGRFESMVDSIFRESEESNKPKSLCTTASH